MRHLLSVLSLLLLAGCASKPETKARHSDLADFNIKGNVIFSEDSVFFFDTAGHLRTDTLAIEAAYFSNGSLDKSEEKDGKGTIQSITTYYHHDNGLWKGWSTYKEGKLQDSIFITLDSAGKYQYGYNYDSSRQLTQTYKELVSNEYDLLTSGRVYKPDGQLKLSFSSTYEGRFPVAEVQLDSAGKETSRTSIKLNKQGEPELETVVKYKDDKPTTTVTRFEYDKVDAGNNWTLQKAFNEAGRQTKEIHRRLKYAEK
ncbi:MAG: hypothetical protein QM781_06905 [Chitinophagaceae bacterium]